MQEVKITIPGSSQNSIFKINETLITVPWYFIGYWAYTSKSITRRQNPHKSVCEWSNLCFCSPPARWGLLDFMSVASSSSSASSCLVLLSSLLLVSLSSSSSSLLNCDPRSTVFSAGPQTRPSTPSVPCRTSTTTIHAQCSLPDLNHDHPRPVFPAGPQPRPSTPSVPCRTSTASIHAKCSLPDLM